jgi:polyribonucleotide nucleotidyltransferase
MFKVYRKEIEWGGRTLILETGKVARQADAAVMATLGETTVLCTVVAAKEAKPDIDFFPLTVNFQEKFFAAGRIPGGFFKREGRPTEKETLISRLIDRPIRPLFISGFKHETQVVCTVLSYDSDADSDIISIIGASAALTLSGLPFMGPIAAAKVGYIDGQYILNPTPQEIQDGSLELVVAGTTEGVLMVESEAKELSEEIMLGAVKFGQEAYNTVIQAIIQLAETCAKDPWDIDLEKGALSADVKKKIATLAQKDLVAAYKEKDKQPRREKIEAAKQKVLEAFADNADVTKVKLLSEFKHLESDILRLDVLKTGKRIDGRSTTDIRRIESEVGILPRTHGSALFTRGETQAIVVTTLGTGDDEQMIDALEGERYENFMLHYNFPPYSVGETGRMGSPGRREIGHGKLAWRAIRPLLPAKETFPYTIRIVSEITESNGSSSMATVCGGSLSLMDAGVPLERPVAGIAMGLIKEGKDFAILSDILGDEDHLGDMDFKVAGTTNGVTALQMDIKITSITAEIMEQALAQAKDGRLHILGEMQKGLDTPRDGVSQHAPRIHTIKIDKDKIRDVIGSGGKVIREICELSGAKVDIGEDGTIKIAATSEEATNDAIRRIRAIVAVPEIGEIYDGTVVRIVEFGAFVNFLGAKDGLVHISEMANYRVKQVSDIVKMGDVIKVKVVGVDERGKIRLTMKLEDATAAEAEDVA